MHVFTHVGTFVMHVMRALLWRSLTKLEQKYDQLYKKSHHKQDCPMCVKDFNYDKSFTQIKKHTLDKLSKPPAPLTFLWGFFCCSLFYYLELMTSVPHQKDSVFSIPRGNLLWVIVDNCYFLWQFYLIHKIKKNIPKDNTCINKPYQFCHNLNWNEESLFYHHISQFCQQFWINNWEDWQVDEKKIDPVYIFHITQERTLIEF